MKINTENAMFSFHEYMPSDYAYMFQNISDMEKGILKLLHDKQEQKRVAEQLYQYYLDHYEETIVRDKYIKLIENSDNLQLFYQALPDSVVYQFKNIK